MSELPGGPVDGGYPRRPGRFSDGGYQGSSAPGGPITIDQSRLPSCAPFTAFIGNLPFDIVESDVRTFFQMRNISAGAILNVKLPRDTVENKSRGFGYVDFATCEDLTRALLASNQFSIRNRVVRVDMSDSKPQSDRESRPSENDRNWRDGARAPTAAAGGVVRHLQEREPRPVSAAEASHNWRDGAKPIERSLLQHTQDQQGTPIMAARSFVPAAVEPVRNWRETAKPVEKKLNEELIEKNPIDFASKTKTSKVPAASWRPN